MTPNRSWSQRWAELRPHPTQLELWSDQTRFKIVTSGRRSGKTELAKRRLAEHLFRKTADGKRGRYFAAAPTRDQAKRVFWDDLKALVRPKWLKLVSETQLRLVSKKGGEIWVVGLDVPQRLEGSPWDGCIIDEIANCHRGIWDKHIRPALADRRGWAWLIGVPDMDSPGQIDYEKLVHRAQSGLDPEWKIFNWPLADVLPPDEVESARRTLDELIFRQEYLGEFVAAQGRAFPNFNPAIHISPIAYDPALSICWSLDFNINPMCSGILQRKGAEVRVIDEIVLPNSDTDSACDAFFQRAQERQWTTQNLFVYGDATGWARDSTSGKSDWFIVEKRLANEHPVPRVPTSNTHVKDTINAVRSLLKPDDEGKSRLLIHPRCSRLIEDLRTALWPGDISEHHALAWFRYFVNREFPINPPDPPTGGSIGFSK